MADPSAATLLPHPTLPSLHGPLPRFAEYLELKEQLCANAIALESSGNGPLGHLALVLPPAIYLQQNNNVAFIVPPHPGEQAPHPAGSTAPQMQEANRTYDLSVTKKKAHDKAETLLKSLVIKAVPEKYFLSLAVPLTKFATVSVLTIMTHLDTKFGVLNDSILNDNREDLFRPWDTRESIDTMWAGIRRARDIATAGNDPITDITTKAAVLTVIEKTGQFTSALDTWHNKDDADKTLENLVIHLDKADAERLRKLTARSAGFHGNALLAADGTAPPTEQALLAPAIAPPAAPPAAHSAQMYYCHTHGLSSSAAHTSMTCRTRAPGHDPTATVDNMKGGCNLIQRRRNEKVVWTAPTRRTPAPAPPAAN